MIKGSLEVAKGRIEEAAGALAGSDKLRAKGRSDQALGHVKQGAERGIRQAKASSREIIDRAKDVAHDAVDKAKHK